MNNHLTTITPGPLATGGDQLTNFDQAAARFLATRKTERTRSHYAAILTDYRRMAEEMDTSPFLADSVIAYSTRLNARRRSTGGDLANDTIRIKLKAVQSFLSWCHTYGLTPLNPGMVADMITMPPAKKLSPRDILTADEARALIAAAKGVRDRCLIRVMLDGGLRVNEAINLRAGDVYTAMGLHFLHVAVTKGDDPRDIEIDGGLFDLLARLGSAEGIDLTDHKQAEQQLFTCHRATAWRIVERTAARAGIVKRLSPHSLRHTHAHNLRLAGWPLEVIGDRLGHKSVETTKRYTRPAELAEAIELPKMPWND